MPASRHLLQHGAFLRRVAWSLLHDEQHVEDAVQDAYLAALERPDLEGGRLRAWLAGVVRNRARRTLRSKARVRRREARAARREAQPSAAEVAARLEAHERLARAVGGLEEPGRTALVMRYLDDMKPRAIAHRLGVPVRTVESRLRRAKARLRERLASESGSGDWKLAILPVLRPTPTGAVGAGSSAGSAAGAASGKAAAAASTAALTGATVMSTKSTILAVGLVCALAGSAGGWLVRGGLSDSRPASEAHAPDLLESEGRPELHGAADSAEARVAKLEQANADLRAQLQRSKAEAARDTASLQAKVAALAKQVEASREAGRPAHAFRGYADALRGIDWKEAGQSLHKLAPQLVRLADAMASGTGIDQDLQKAIQQDQIPLLEIALGLKRKGLPGTGGNGAFTHPSVVANLIDATLAQAGVPLDDGQRERLFSLAERTIREDDERRAGYGADALAFQEFVEESRLKDRFYQAVDALLTPNQRKVLHTDAVRDVVGLDLFCSGLMWQGQYRFQQGPTREAIAAGATSTVQHFFGAQEADRQAIEAAVGNWIEAYPKDALTAPIEAFERVGMSRMSRVRAAWDPMLGLYRELLRTLPPESPMRAKIQDSSLLLLPVLHTP